MRRPRARTPSGCPRAAGVLLVGLPDDLALDTGLLGFVVQRSLSVSFDAPRRVAGGVAVTPSVPLVDGETVAWCGQTATVRADAVPGPPQALWGEDGRPLSPAALPQPDGDGHWRVVVRGPFDADGLIADDPLIGARALSVARFSIRRDEDWQAMGRAPIRPDLDRPFTSVVDPNTRFIVRAFPTHQPEPRVRVGRTSAKVRARWAIDFGAGTSKLTLAGEIAEPKVDGGEKRVPLRAAPEDGPVRADEVLVAWVNGPLAPHGRGDRANRWLRVPFRGLKPVEIESFRKDIALGAVEVPGAGDCDDARLTGVPIAPATREDAQTWSMARLDHLIREAPAYRDRVQVRRVRRAGRGHPARQLRAEAPVAPRAAAARRRRSGPVLVDRGAGRSGPVPGRSEGPGRAAAARPPGG